MLLSSSLLYYHSYFNDYCHFYSHHHYSYIIFIDFSVIFIFRAEDLHKCTGVQIAALAEEGSVEYADWPKTMPRKEHSDSHIPKNVWERKEKKIFNEARNFLYRKKKIEIEVVVEEKSQIEFFENLTNNSSDINASNSNKDDNNGNSKDGNNNDNNDDDDDSKNKNIRTNHVDNDNHNDTTADTTTNTKLIYYLILLLICYLVLLLIWC